MSDESTDVAASLDELASSVNRIASAITPVAVGNNGANGGYVESLTEAVMDASHGLKAIADALMAVAEAIHDHD